jgi:hypothetical protein
MGLATIEAGLRTVPGPRPALVETRNGTERIRKYLDGGQPRATKRRPGSNQTITSQSGRLRHREASLSIYDDLFTIALILNAFMADGLQPLRKPGILRLYQR